jgi:hypothetical protein
MALMLETDPSEILNEIIYATRKGGNIGIVGVYAGFCNHFNIGAFMEKVPVLDLLCHTAPVSIRCQCLCGESSSTLNHRIISITAGCSSASSWSAHSL